MHNLFKAAHAELNPLVWIARPVAFLVLINLPKCALMALPPVLNEGAVSSMCRSVNKLMRNKGDVADLKVKSSGFNKVRVI